MNVLTVSKMHIDGDSAAHSGPARRGGAGRKNALPGAALRLSVVFLMLGVVVLLHGCRPASESTEERPASGKSSVELLVDGITGKYAVEAGERAKADIQAISERRDAQLEEVLEE